MSHTKSLRIIVFFWIIILLAVAISAALSVYRDLVEKEHNTFRSIRHLFFMSCTLAFSSLCAIVLTKALIRSGDFSDRTITFLVSSARVSRILVLLVVITLLFLWYQKQPLDLDMILVLIIGSLFSGYGFFTLWWLKKHDFLPESDD